MTNVLMKVNKNWIFNSKLFIKLISFYLHIQNINVVYINPQYKITQLLIYKATYLQEKEEISLTNNHVPSILQALSNIINTMNKNYQIVFDTKSKHSTRIFSFVNKFIR